MPARGQRAGPITASRIHRRPRVATRAPSALRTSHMSRRPSARAAARTGAGRSHRAFTDVVNHRPKNSQISCACSAVALDRFSPATAARLLCGGLGERSLGGAPFHHATAVAGHVGTHGLSFQKDMVSRKVDKFPCDHLNSPLRHRMSEAQPARSKRCAHPECKKKLMLTDSACRCGKIHCPLHRHSETHACTFDYRQLSRENLLKTMSTAVVGEKLQMI